MKFACSGRSSLRNSPTFRTTCSSGSSQFSKSRPPSTTTSNLRFTTTVVRRRPAALVALTIDEKGMAKDRHSGAAPFLLFAWAAQTLPASYLVILNAATPMFAATIATMKSQCELSLTTVGLNPARRQASMMWPWSANSGR